MQNTFSVCVSVQNLLHLRQNVHPVHHLNPWHSAPQASATSSNSATRLSMLSLFALSLLPPDRRQSRV